MFLLSALPALWNAKPIPLGSAESKKETNSLRPPSLSGDYKLSNSNTILYLRIRVLRDLVAKLKSFATTALPLETVCDNQGY